MFNIKVEKVLEKDICGVFDILTDDENFNRFRAVSNSKLLKPGSDEKCPISIKSILNQASKI